MVKKILRIALSVAILCWLPGIHARPESNDLERAGALRTASQQAAKLYFQILLEPQDASARRALTRLVTRVDQDLDHLRAAAVTPARRRTYDKIRTLWAQSRPIVAAAPAAPAAGGVLNDLADELMIASGRLAFLLERDAEGGTGRLVDLSLRQAMLAQRLAKLYLARRALGPSAASLVDVAQARTEFTTALSELTRAPDNTQQTRDALDLAVAQWIFFDQAIAAGDNGDRRFVRNVSTTSERISESMDDVVAAYGAEMARRAAAATAPPPTVGSNAALVRR